MSQDNDNLSRDISADLKELPKLYCVELPCFVKSAQAAVRMLGGEQAIAGVMQHTDNSPLWLQFPNDHSPLSQGLKLAVNEQRPSLLVRMVRRRKKSSSDPFVTHKVELLGFVDKTWTCAEPADYQFLPSSTDVDFYQSKRADQIIEAIPQSFARQEFASRPHFLHYEYDPYRLLHLKANRERAEGDSESGEEEDNEDEEKAKRNPDAGHTALIKYVDPVPDQHVHGSHPPRWHEYHASYRGFKLMDKLRKIFNIVPVMTRLKAVQLLGTVQKQHLFKECLPYAAYCHVNGPFLRLWLRFGYDVTKDPMSRFFQSIVMRFSPQFLDEMSFKLVNHIGKVHCENRMVDLDRMCLTDPPIEFAHLFINKGANARVPVSIFGSIVKHQVYPQIHYLMDPEILEFVETLKVLPQCNEHTGWYTPQGLDALRKFIPEVVAKRVDQFIAKNPVVKYEKATNFDLLEDEVVEKRLDMMGKFMHTKSREEEEELRPMVDPTIVWLKKYQEGASRSPIATEEDVLRGHTIAQMPSAKSAIYNRLGAPSSSSLPVPPVVAPSPALARPSPSVAKIPQQSQSQSQSQSQATPVDISAVSQSEELIATINRIQSVYSASAFNIFGESDSEDSS